MVTYTVTDANGCTDNDTEQIEVLAAPAADIGAVAPQCANGSVIPLTATPAQGTNYWTGPGIIDPINGAFSPTFAGVGIHTVMVAKTYTNGCVVTATEDITVNALPDATINAIAPLCANAAPLQLTAVTPGGIWSGTGITPGGVFDPGAAGVGTHTVSYTVDDLGTGCSNTDEEDVIVTPPLVITAVVDDAACKSGADGAINVTVVGGMSPYAYTWTNGANTQDLNDLMPGNYGLTVTDVNGCTESASYTINEPPALDTSTVITPALTPSFNNGAINLTVSGGTPPYTYIWSNGQTTQDVSGLQPDCYHVTIIDAKGCRYYFNDICVPALFGVGITAQDLHSGMSLYPNPTDGLIHFDLDLGVTADVNLTLTDVLGRLVYVHSDRMVNTFRHDIDMSQWASGQYILNVQVGDVIVNRKVILAK